MIHCPQLRDLTVTKEPISFVFVLFSDDAYVGCYKDTNVHVMYHEFTVPSKKLRLTILIHEARLIVKRTTLLSFLACERRRISVSTDVASLAGLAYFK